METGTRKECRDCEIEKVIMLLVRNKLKIWNQAVTIHLLFPVLVLWLVYASESRTGNSSIG